MADKEQSSDGSAPVNNPLSRKLNKILESRLDSDKDVLEALKSLSGFFLENNLRSRRNLRGDIERRSLTINEEFVQCFQNVKEQLDSLYEDVQGMNECCEDMTTRLKSAKEQTHDLISQTTKLQTESQRLEMRCKLADAFLNKFQLKSEEVKILRGTRGGTLHHDFFTVLNRVKQIHTDCKVLLRTNQQRAGLEIMESMALHQETAYERLYRWAQNECRLLTSDSPDVGHQLCQAMEALQDRPVLFRYALDEFGTARRTAIARGFIDALTRGGPGGTPRPIELHSHDPLRYVGDMLAWLHQAMASEKEHIYALVKQCKPNALNDQVQSVLSHISEGVCRNFKTRLEQVLVAQPGTVLLYKLANLLKFYYGTIGQILEGGGLLISTVEEMQVLSLSMFFTSLNTHAAKLLDKVELPPADLGVTTSLNQTLQLLKDILASHDASMVPLDSRKQDFQKILSCMVEPLIQMCSMSASRLNAVDMATYMVNCIYSVQVTLSLYEFTDQRLEMLRAQIDAHLDTLVSEQASFILARAGLAQVYSAIQQYQPKQGPLSNIPGMDALSIKDCMKKFDSYLASPDNLVMSQCSKLLSGNLRETVKRRSVELICEAFKQMYTALTNVDNGYPEPMSLVPRTPEQVQKLLL